MCCDMFDSKIWTSWLGITCCMLLYVMWLNVLLCHYWCIRTSPGAFLCLVFKWKNQIWSALTAKINKNSTLINKFHFHRKTGCKLILILMCTAVFINRWKLLKYWSVLNSKRKITGVSCCVTNGSEQSDRMWVRVGVQCLPLLIYTAVTRHSLTRPTTVS